MGDGQCAACQKKKMSVGGQPLHTKLAITEPGDAYEQEADRMVEQVMRMSPGDVSRSQSGGLIHPFVQRRATSGATGLAEAPPIVHEVLNSPGQPFDPATRAFFEPRFGQDFSHVRVHTDAKAADSARAANALAYTVGGDVVVGIGHAAIGSAFGQRVLAHELAHVVQQSASPEVPVLQRASTAASPANARYESMSLEEAIKHLGEMSQDQALVVLKRWQKYILNSINEGEGRIRQYIKLRAESFANYLIGGTIEFFGRTSIPSDDWKEPWRRLNAAYGLIAKRQVTESVVCLSDAAAATCRHWEQMHEFEDKFEAGAGRSILALQGLEVAGAVAITVLTAGQGTAVMVGAGSAYAGTQRFAGEATSVAIGTKDRIDFAGIAFDMIFAALMGKFLGPLGGKVANGVGGAIIKQVGEGAARQVLAKITGQFVASILVGRASGLLHGVAFQIFNAVRGEKRLSMDDFMQMVADQLSADAFFLDIVGTAAGIAFVPGSVAPNRPKPYLVKTPPVPKAGGSRPPGRAAPEPSNVIPLRPRGNASALGVGEPTGASVPMARRGGTATLLVAEPAPVSKPAVEPIPAKPGLRAVASPVGPKPAPMESVVPTAVAMSQVVTQPKSVPKKKGDPKSKCQYPTGRTKEDPIPIQWFKPRSDFFYPGVVSVQGHSYGRDGGAQELPHGEPFGVEEERWPYHGKILQLKYWYRPRRAASDVYRNLLTEYGYHPRTGGLQIDHVQDPQWGVPDGDLNGAALDDWYNLWPLTSDLNMSAGGRQNNNQTVSFCEGPDGPARIDVAIAQIKNEGRYGLYFKIDRIDYVS